MRRLALIAILGWTIASPSIACTIMYSPPRSGETLEQASIREERAAQVTAWATADSVFLARVIDTSGADNGGMRYTFQPIAPIHGIAPPRRLSGTWFADGCQGPEWSRGDLAIVCADRIDWDEYWPCWGQWQEIKAMRPAAAFDSRIADALRASVNQLRTDPR